MDSSKEVEVSVADKYFWLRYSYILLSGFMIFMLSTFAALAISEETNIRYEHFVHPLIWFIGFVVQFKNRITGLLIITVPVIYMIGTILWIIF
ncbi:hypothetical protein [Fictibacillus barbaricus]|uniref:Uncharacterized protein n=1 Tax=Fictibacillus barbaricus TaxID=182136 RepID=A0ABU1TWK4_9BACL|nr:hypothetical protein [Fictibacillus barbaricus]MDR7071555.1 hypothetical protein [Fictibacillus barbaricus]